MLGKRNVAIGTMPAPVNRGSPMIKTSLAVTVSLLALTAPVRGQTVAPAAPTVAANDGAIADIVVTAQRRAEKSQDVPIAISAFAAADLQAKGIHNALDIGQYVPNLIAQNNTGLGSANAYYLRGLGNVESIPTFDPPVGTYVDDIYLSRQNANNLNFFDVERVEVLRGPQGTLFGKNTTGGAISVILRQPGKELGGFAEVGYGSYNNKLARGSLDIPLAEGLQIKVSGYYQANDGYVRDTITNQRFNKDDGWGARLGVHADLSDHVQWNAGFAHIVDNSDNTLNFTCNPANPTDCSGRFSTTGLSTVAGAANFAALGITGAKANFGNGNRTSTELLTSNFSVALSPAVTINLITGYVSQRQKYALDFFDGRSAPSIANPNPAIVGNARGGFTIVNDGYEDQFSQEVKLSGKLFGGFVDYVAGFYYLNEYNRTDFADVFAGFLVLDDHILRNTTEDKAGYAQADVNVTSRFKLTAGIRYTNEIKTISLTDTRPRCNTGPVPANCLNTSNLISATGLAIPTSLTSNVWTPRFAASFKVTDTFLAYASATRGFKGGGWNARSSSPGLTLPFDPEKVWSYEGGFKSDFLNHHVRFNLTGFWEEVSDLQVISGFANPATGALTFLTRNFANYRNRGLEAELTVNPVRGLSLYANGGYQNSRYLLPANAPAFDKYNVRSVASQQAACQAQLRLGGVGGTSSAPSCANGLVTAQGNIATPTRTPDFTLALGGSYEAPITRGLTLVPSINASYHSKQEVATSNLTIYTGAVAGPTVTYPSNPTAGTEITGSLSRAAWIVNAGLALQGPDRKWQLSVDCSNCFDKAFYQSDLGNFSYFNPPRTWTARLKYTL